ncbi:hypothetical protein Q8F55_003367 [Vanrija albida]|uniref:SWI/SNF and RSC complexes subunit Ssr4 C-terminal domain-containing protein n=1 Tax=Vanrija albida TaxID=181172 RepID=A0ABR3Q3U5_9TREE
MNNFPGGAPMFPAGAGGAGGQGLPPHLQQQQQRAHAPPGHPQAAHFAGINQPGLAHGPPGHMQVDPAHLAMLQQQGWAQQQQQQQQQAQLAALASAGQLPHALAVRQQQAQAAAQAQAPSGKKKNKRGPAGQLLPRHMAAMQPPHGADAYAKNAMAPPGIAVDNIEPWADLLDELDPRELAMGRFRTRHEIMAEIFGPEPVNSIPDVTADPWEGLGVNGETLEAKVLSLEKSNAELEANFEADLEAWRKRLEEASRDPAAVAAA